MPYQLDQAAQGDVGFGKTDFVGECVLEEEGGRRFHGWHEKGVSGKAKGKMTR